MASTPGITPNSSFSTKNPNMQLAWDSTSIGLLKECPRKYQLSIAVGWAPRLESVHLRFGIEYHHALEFYDHARSKGTEHYPALCATVREVLVRTWDRALGRPWWSDHPQKNRETLVRTVIWYLDKFKDDPLHTVQLANGKPAVELSFRWETDMETQDHEPLLLCGHLDRIATAPDGRTFIVDRKTTGTTLSTSYFDKFSPDNQFSLYSLAGRVVYSQNIAGLIVDAAQVATGFSRFERGLVARPTASLDEWYSDLGIWLSLAERFALANRWPMNDKSCNNYGGCPFRGVCAAAPGVRDEWLRASYARRTWDPLQVRGDI